MEDVAATIARMASAVERVSRLAARGRLDSLDDEAIVSLIADAAEVRKSVDLVLAAAAAVVLTSGPTAVAVRPDSRDRTVTGRRRHCCRA